MKTDSDSLYSDSISIHKIWKLRDVKKLTKIGVLASIDWIIIDLQDNEMFYILDEQYNRLDSTKYKISNNTIILIADEKSEDENSSQMVIKSITNDTLVLHVIMNIRNELTPILEVKYEELIK